MAAEQLKDKWHRVEWGPKYLKLRETWGKKGVTHRHYLRAEKSGLPPLVMAVPEELTSRKAILAFAELEYSKWRSQESKPEVVEAVEEVVEKATTRFVTVSKTIEELTESMSDEYLRKAKYHIKRLNQWFGVECEFISDWNDNLWPKYVAYRRKLLPGCQLNHDKRQLSRILLHAYNEGLIKTKPKLKSVDAEAKGGRALSDAELDSLYTEAARDLQDEMDLGLRQAFRQIDVRHLAKDRVDLTRGKVAFKRGSLSAEGGQKNKKPLTLDLNPVCLEMLKRRAAENDARWGKDGWTYFFYYGSGNTAENAPQNPHKPKGSNKTAWYATCRRAGVEAGFHCLRHTCATKMARAGMPEAFTQKFCRMSARVVRDIYTHLESEDSKRLAGVIVRKFGDTQSPAPAPKEGG